MVVPRGVERTAERSAEDNRHKRAHLQKPVAARKRALRKRRGKDAVFCRAEERGVQSHEKDDDQHRFDDWTPESDSCESHDGNFKDFDCDQHAALTIDVGQMTGVTGKKRGWQNKQESNHFDIVAVRRADHRVVRNQRHHHLVKVIVEGAEELRPEEAEEASVLQQIDISVFTHGPGHASELDHFSAKREKNSRQKSVFRHFLAAPLRRPLVRLDVASFYVTALAGDLRGFQTRRPGKRRGFSSIKRPHSFSNRWRKDIQKASAHHEIVWPGRSYVADFGLTLDFFL